ncbi:MAG: TPM domain-containing protein, partial [Chloroflexota bacterium]|nr:TPM domain-containing protein [Chloroflexota bacterium]
MTLIRRLAPILIGALTLLLAVSPVAAQTLTGDDRVVDEIGVITGDQRSEALDAIERLDDGQNVQLWALFVGTTSGEPIADYATRIAAENGL